MGSILTKCREREDDLRDEIASIEALPVSQQNQERLEELKRELKDFYPCKPLVMTKSILGSGF